MGLWARLRAALGRAALGRAAPSIAAQGWTIVRGDQPTQYQATGRSVRIQGWERHPVVHACTRAIVDLLSAVPLQVYRLDADGDPVVVGPKESELARRLQAPRVAMTQQRLLGLTSSHILLYGNAFWKLERPGQREMRPGDALAPGPLPAPATRSLPTSLRLVHPEHILYAFLDADTLEVLQWQWRDRIGRVHYARAEDMVHFPDLNASDWVFGYPRAATAINAIVGDSEASQYVREVVTNDGSPPIVFLLEQPAADGEIEAARQRWLERVVHRGGRGTPEFLGGVRDVKAVGFNLQQLEFPDLRRVAREDICAAFGVDPHMIGIASAQGRSSTLAGQQYEEARFRLLHHTVKPLMALIEAQLNLWLSPEYGDEYVRFDPDRLEELSDTTERRSKRLVTEVAAGIRTLEEVRPLLGLESDPDPEHTLAAAATVTFRPVAELATPPPPPLPPSGRPGGNGKPHPGAIDPAQLHEPPAPVDGPQRMLRRGVLLTPDQRRHLWRAADTRAQAQESSYEHAALAVFAQERMAVAALLAGGPRQALEDSALLADALERLGHSYGPEREFWRGWVQAFRALVESTMRQAGRAVAPEVQIPEQAVYQRVNKLAGDVTATTYRRIQDIVAEGQREGWPMRQIADAIDREVFGSEAPARARVIARTETIGAQNAGEFAAAAASGVIGEKEWLTQGDDRVRDTHAAQDGQRVPLHERFANGLLYPGDQHGPAEEVVNCRCTLLFHEGGASGARQAVLEALRGGR